VEVFGGGAVGVIDNFKEARFICRDGCKEREDGSGGPGAPGEMEALLKSIVGNRPHRKVRGIPLHHASQLRHPGIFAEGQPMEVRLPKSPIPGTELTAGNPFSHSLPNSFPWEGPV